MGLATLVPHKRKMCNDIRMDGHGAIISPALLLLPFWGQYWIQAEVCVWLGELWKTVAILPCLDLGDSGTVVDDYLRA